MTVRKLDDLGTIDKIEIVYNPNRGYQPTGEQVLERVGPGQRLECANPLCQRGGMLIYPVVKKMVVDGQSRLKGHGLCPGREGLGASARDCIQGVDFEIEITYASEETR